MNSDKMGLAIVALLIVAVILGFLQYYTIAWIVVIVGVILIVLAKLKG